VTLDFVGSATVTAVTAQPTVRRRLAEMGIRPGCHIRVLHRTTGGGRVVAVGGARVALDSSLAAAVETDRRP
jgi:ferrous iron transport protein A